MSGVLLALRRSLGSLARGRVWLYLLGPVLVAMLLMVGLSIVLLDRLIAVFVEQLQVIAQGGAIGDSGADILGDDTSHGIGVAQALRDERIRNMPIHLRLST